jgi:signal peptidase I
MSISSVLKKIWNFLWHSNSVWSFIVDVILIFLIVKFLLLPGLGLALNTSVPMVIVESGSMEHIKNTYDKVTPFNICGHNYGQKANVDFDEYWRLCGHWYEDINITQAEFSKFSFNNGFNKGDIMVIQGKKEYKVGDIIVFKVPQYGTPIIHRIIYIREIGGIKVYSTKGDHNSDQIPYELSITQNQILGKAIAKAPWFGWVKLFFVDMFR